MRVFSFPGHFVLQPDGERIVLVTSGQGIDREHSLILQQGGLYIVELTVRISIYPHRPLF